MGAVAATWAVVGSLILLRFYAFSAAVLLCRKALQQGQPFEAEVGWSLSLKLKTGRTSEHSATDARSKPGGIGDSLLVRGSGERLQRDLGPGDQRRGKGKAPTSSGVNPD
jgi:hypothetical protein